MHSEEQPKPDPSLEALADRLRALTEPAVPAGLEARLLAAVATARPARVALSAVKDNSDRQAWFALASAVLALASVGLLAMFVSRDRDAGENLVAIHDVSRSASQNRSLPTDELTDAVLSPLDERILQRAGVSNFRWPLQETPIKASYSISRNLSD